MKKVVFLFCSLFVLAASVYAISFDKTPKKAKKVCTPEMNCANKEEARACTKEMKAAAKREGKICCVKKTENQK